MSRSNSQFFGKDKLGLEDRKRVMSIDLETLIGPEGFLSGERIIAVSVSRGYPEIKTDVLVAEDDTKSEEDRILREFDALLGAEDPQVIIGYNHTGYDIPLLQLKMRGRAYSEQFWNLKYTLGTSYTMDMMYAIAHDISNSGEVFRIRKLRDVVQHRKYNDLPLLRAKDLVVSPTMDVGQAIRSLWENDRKNFIRYCVGDTHDILQIFFSMF